jgi:hypothetical protein
MPSINSKLLPSIFGGKNVLLEVEYHPAERKPIAKFEMVVVNPFYKHPRRP